MNSGLIAKRYARAFFSAVKDAGEVEAAGDAVKRAVEAFLDAEGAEEFWSSPSVGLDEKRALVERICASVDIGGSLKSFLMLLLEKKRLRMLSDIAREIDRYCSQYLKEAVVEVVSATALNEERAADIRRALESKTGNKITLNVEQDPALLGGVIVRLGDEIYDGSVKGYLERLQSQMAEL